MLYLQIAISSLKIRDWECLNKFVPHWPYDPIIIPSDLPRVESERLIDLLSVNACPELVLIPKKIKCVRDCSYFLVAV